MHHYVLVSDETVDFFLLSVWYDATFCLWEKNSIDNTPVFQLFLNSAVQDVSSSCTVLPAKGVCVGGWGEWWGTRRCNGADLGQLTQTGQSDIPNHMTSCEKTIKLRSVGQGGQPLFRVWLGLGQQVVSNFIICFINILYFYHYYYYTFSFCLSKLFLSQPTSSTCFLSFFFWSSSIPLGEGSEQMTVVLSSLTG